MNYISLLQISIILIIVLGITALLFQAKKRKWLQKNDIKNINLCFNLSYSLAKKIGLNKQPYAKEMLENVNEALKYLKNIENKTFEDVTNEALTLTLKICKRKNININDERKEILKVLINIGVKQIMYK